MANPSDEEEKPIKRDYPTSGAYCFSDLSSNENQNSTLHASFFQGFLPTPSSSSEIYSFNPRSMETMTMIGFHSNKGINSDDLNNIVSNNNNNGSAPLADDPPQRYVFPCEANERPGQGLSLSLSSSNPSSIVLQSFELRRRRNDLNNSMRLFGPSSSSYSVSASDVRNLHQQPSSEQLRIIRNSKYLGPAKEFLNELCSLIGDEKMKGRENSEYTEALESANKIQELYSLDPMELQRRKTKLLQMLDEVDRRYKQYRNHMKAMVTSFEAVAGNGSSAAYTSLASKAMSRHFRCLRDGIVRQIKATKAVMGDKGIVIAAPGTSSGWRLGNYMMETTFHPWRRRRGLPEKPVSVLRAWLFEHFLHPYPSDADKQMLALKTGLTRSQVSNWYINARVRLWKPMVEQMYLDELKEEEEEANHSPNLDHRHDQNYRFSRKDYDDDREPAHDRFFRAVDELPNHQSSYDEDMQQQQLDEFSEYSGGMNNGGVSLTLGLNHRDVITISGGGNEGLFRPFSSSTQSSLFYNPARSRFYEDHGQNLSYSSLVDDGAIDDQGQSLIRTAQLLHDMDA